MLFVLEKYENLKCDVQAFRTAIEKAKNDEQFIKDINFHQFPIACCGDASDLLGHYLLTKGIITKYVCGNYYGDNEENGQSHSWLLLDDEIIIDITGDQFRFNPIFLRYDNPVYVGPCDEFHSLFEVDDRDVRDISFIDELGLFCAPRLIKNYSIITSYISDCLNK